MHNFSSLSYGYAGINRYPPFPEAVFGMQLNTEIEVLAALLNFPIARLTTFQMGEVPERHWDSVDVRVVQASDSVAAAAGDSTVSTLPTPEQLLAGTSRRSGSGKRRLFPDISLVCRGSTSKPTAAKRQRTSAAAAAPLQGQGSLCVCEVKGIEKMSTDGKAGDLAALFNNEDQCSVHIINQLHSYMIVMQLEFGMLSCYNFTVLAWRPLDRPSTLLLSRAYAASSRAPEVTAMAAMAWLQSRAVQQILVNRQRHLPYSTTAGGGGGLGPQHPPSVRDDEQGGEGSSGADQGGMGGNDAVEGLTIGGPGATVNTR